MKSRTIMAMAIACMVSSAAFAQQKGIAGKWGTDSAIARLKGGAAPAEAPGGRGGGGGQAVILDLKVDGSNKVTGGITEFGNTLCGDPDTKLPLDSGSVEGKVVTFQTTRPVCPGVAAPAGGAPRGNNFAQAPQGAPGAGGGQARGGGGGTMVIWTGTLSDDEQTLSVTRAIQGGGGRGGRGGGPGGAGAPGGAPRGNNFAQAPQGAPGAGGGQGRGAGAGGGRGGGGGALVMHRIP